MLNAAALSTYDFSLKYRSGVQNINADAFSHRPHPTPTQEQEWNDISAAGVRTMFQMSAMTKQGNQCPSRAIDHLGPSMHAIPQAILQSVYPEHQGDACFESC